MRFFANRELYYRTAECLAWLRETSFDGPAATSSERELCHFYWYGDFSLKQTFAVMSFLATQDLDRTELWLWLDGESAYDGHEENPLLRPLLPYVQVHRFDAKIAARGTPAQRRPELYEDVTPTARSDFVRCVVLFKYGGIYIDMDMMLIRDLGGLPPDEFCYPWGTKQPYGNSAFMRLRQGSETAHEILATAAAKRSCHPHTIFHFDHCADLDILVLPCPFFDPLWPHHEGSDTYEAAPFSRFRGFFRRFGPRAFPQTAPILTYRDFFPGAFAYHWHNYWDVPEIADSYFGFFYQEFEAILDERLGVEWPVDELALVPG
jgi:hypothetical protein